MDYEGISVFTTGVKGQKPSVNIADIGEGQTPEAFPITLLSLGKRNKYKVLFAQGKYGQGSSGAIRFCGKHKLQLIVSKRHPKLLNNPAVRADYPKHEDDDCWGMTIVRREVEGDNIAMPFLSYLAPISADAAPRNGRVLRFKADEMPLFPKGDNAYQRNVAHGTLVKLYEYKLPSTSNILRRSGMQKPASGSVATLNGSSIITIPHHHIVESGLALVPEGRGLFVDLTVAENLLLGAYPSRARMKEATNFERVLGLFPRLKERLRQRVVTMSGGEQQMVAIARALMSVPQVLLLDEPSLGLSPLMSQELFRAIRGVCDSGVGVLMVEQNANLSLAIADRGYLIETGRIVGTGNAVQLREDPSVQRAYLGGTT